MEIDILGIDLAKHVFQLHGTERSGRAVHRSKVGRGATISGGTSGVSNVSVGTIGTLTNSGTIRSNTYRMRRLRHAHYFTSSLIDWQRFVANSLGSNRDLGATALPSLPRRHASNNFPSASTFHATHHDSNSPKRRNPCKIAACAGVV